MRTKLQKLSFKIAALTLCLWLSGATCAISCGTMVVRAATETPSVKAEVVEESSCHGKTRRAKTDGEKADKGFSLRSNFGHQATLDCCSFLNLTAEKTGNVAHFNSQIAAPVSPLETFTAKFERQTVSFQIFYQPIQLNRGSTYLRNCVFRI